ncbi:MAG: hypothetical protein WCA20_31715 [Candidatus Sulfotelmatobacter sp.]
MFGSFETAQQDRSSSVVSEGSEGYWFSLELDLVASDALMKKIVRESLDGYMM